MEPRSGRRNRNNAPNPREIYSAGDGFTARRRLEETTEKCTGKREERNMRRRMRLERGDGGCAYLVRYVGYVNVIIPQILKGERELSYGRARGEEGRPGRIDRRSGFLKYG